MAAGSGTRTTQVKVQLLNYIVQNHLKRMDQLPSEAAIARQLGVSRNTLREAYISLENEGIIVRRHGIGTFVAHAPVIHDSLNEFSSFAQIIVEGGYRPDFETLSIGTAAAVPEACDVFQLPHRSELLRIKRLVLADRRPVIYVEDYLAPSVGEDQLPWEAFDGNMVYFLNRYLDRALHQIQSRIRAAAPGEDVAGLLNLEPGTPVLAVRSTIYALEGQPVNYSRVYFNSKFVELNIVRMIRTSESRIP